MIDTLTKYEWMIMEALWQKQPMFLSEIMDGLKRTIPWKRTTYLTYLKRMCDKSFIGYEEIRGSRSYYPLVSREKCVQNESCQMITKMTDDSAKLFLTCMIQDSGLSQEAGDELKELIDTLASAMKEKEGQ
jgi:BlaI family penicillinase repressor